MRRAGEGMDVVLRFDTDTGKEDYYHFSPCASAGEFAFAPRVGGTREGDGYVMTILHAADSPFSYLCIFNTLDIASGPIARAHFPFRLHSGFHCNYYSSDNPLFLQVISH